MYHLIRGGCCWVNEVECNIIFGKGETWSMRSTDDKIPGRLVRQSYMKTSYVVLVKPFEKFQSWQLTEETWQMSEESTDLGIASARKKAWTIRKVRQQLNNLYENGQ
jgi:hypothetical protein